MGENSNRKWYVIRVISGKEKKIKGYIEFVLDTFLSMNHNDGVNDEDW